MKKCNVYTLSQVVERYCILLFNDHRKGFKNFLVMAQMAWDEIFNRTLWCYQSEWLPVQSGSPYPFIELPENISAFMHLCDEAIDCDGVKRLVPLLQDSGTSISKKPVQKVCGCTANCNCGEACKEVNSFSFEEKDVIIDNVTYKERTWTEVCPNGDVLKWREVPVKNYSNGHLGEFTLEFSSDEFTTPEAAYVDAGTDFNDDTYFIDTVKTQERVCKLEVKECGCIAETAENRGLLFKYCGCRFGINSSRSMPVFKDRTYFQFSDCGSKIFIVGKAKEMYHLTYQAKGASAKAPVPEYAVKSIMDSIDYFSKIYNPSIGDGEKMRAAARKDRSRLDIIEYLNPIDLDFLYRLNEIH